MKNIRIKRSVDNRLIGGVCGGIAEHLNLSPILVRLLSLLIPAPLLFDTYISLVNLMPEDYKHLY